MQLNDRQLDILQEMGISLLGREFSSPLSPLSSLDPPSGVARASSPAREASLPQAVDTQSGRAAPSTRPTRAPSLAAPPSSSLAHAHDRAPREPLPALQSMPWPALLEQAQHCQACSLGTGAKARLFGLSSWSPTKVTPWPMAPAPDNTLAAPKPSPVLIVADAPQLDANGQALAFSAISHPLFEQFLRAASWLARGASDKDSRATSGEPNDEIMITHMVKCVGARPSVDPQHYHTCAAYLRAQILHLKPLVLLVMGRMAAQTLVHNTERQGLPHGKLCGQLLDFEGTPMVVTQPPEYLWRTGQDKGKSWHDLCLALSVVQAAREK